MAGDYSFTEITESSGGFSFPSLNAAGAVAWIQDGGNSLMVGDGGPVTILYDGGGIGPFRGFGGHPSINDDGVVAFIANSSTLPGRVFAGDGGLPTPMAPNCCGGTTNVDINSSGMVVFSSYSGSHSVFVSDGGLLTTIADANNSLWGFDDPSINNQGMVVFHALFNTGGGGIFMGDGGSLITIADSSGPFYFDGNNSGRQPSINDNGTVVFIAALDAGGKGIFTRTTDAQITTIVTTGDVFRDFDDQGPAINGNGVVTFRARLTDGGVGIFTGPDPLADKVIARGDPLFGSTVTGIYIGLGEELNDAGQVAFFADLADGRRMIVRANPVTPVPIDTQIQCNTPATIVPADAPISFTATATATYVPAKAPISSTATAPATYVPTKAPISSTATAPATIAPAKAPISSTATAPATIAPAKAPISSTATATDTSGSMVPTVITGVDCFKFTKKGKRIDKTESCVVSVNNDTVTISDSGGVGDHITWTVTAGNYNDTCEVVVVNPGKGRGKHKK